MIILCGPLSPITNSEDEELITESGIIAPINIVININSHITIFFQSSFSVYSVIF